MIGTGVGGLTDDTSHHNADITGPRAPSSMESFLYIDLFVFAYCYTIIFSSTASTHPSPAQRRPPRNPLTIPTKTDLCLGRSGAEYGLSTSSAYTQITRSS